MEKLIQRRLKDFLNLLGFLTTVSKLFSLSLLENSESKDCINSSSLPVGDGVCGPMAMAWGVLDVWLLDAVAGGWKGHRKDFSVVEPNLSRAAVNPGQITSN